MILESEYVFRAMELRIKTKPIVGTLCFIEDPKLIHNAMRYFDCWNHEQYISQPFIEIDKDLYENMDLELFKIYVELLRFWMPPCTTGEIRSTIDLCKKFGYELNRHKDRISIRRIKDARTSLY